VQLAKRHDAVPVTRDYMYPREALSNVLRQARDEQQLDDSVRGELGEPQAEPTVSAFPEMKRRGR